MLIPSSSNGIPFKVEAVVTAYSTVLFLPGDDFEEVNRLASHLEGHWVLTHELIPVLDKWHLHLESLFPWLTELTESKLLCLPVSERLAKVQEVVDQVGRSVLVPFPSR